jgi:hypothetical protein
MDPAAGKAVTTDAAVQLVQAIAALGGDTDYLIDALTQTLRSLRPVSTESALDDAERRFLIESGTFTETEFEGAMTAVGRGELQLVEVESWMFRLLDTLSAEQAADQLELTGDELDLAVRARELLSLKVAGRLRFPRWQFVTSPEGRLLPGLEVLIPEAPPYGILSWAAFMHSPMEELSGFGPQTPIQWLREGGDVEAVLEILRDEEIA